MTNFQQRLITGISIIAIIIITIISGPTTFAILILIVNLIGLNEFYTLLHSFSPYKTTGSIASAILFISSSLFVSNYLDWQVLLLNIPMLYSFFIVALYSKSEKPFTELAFTILGIIYITVPFIFLITTTFLTNRQGFFEPNIIIGLFLIVWASDSGAYAFGKLFGKHHLFERISPNKTWEGSLGGAFCSLLVAFLISLFFKELNLIDWILISLIVIIIGTYGDLIKSLLKRSLKVKDAGTILPGHGGILDRFDSIIGSAPFVFSYLILR